MLYHRIPQSILNIDITLCRSNDENKQSCVLKSKESFDHIENRNKYKTKKELMKPQKMQTNTRTGTSASNKYKRNKEVKLCKS